MHVCRNVLGCVSPAVLDRAPPMKRAHSESSPVHVCIYSNQELQRLCLRQSTHQHSDTQLLLRAASIQLQSGQSQGAARSDRDHAERNEDKRWNLLFFSFCSGAQVNISVSETVFLYEIRESTSALCTIYTTIHPSTALPSGHMRQCHVTPVYCGAQN